MLDKIEFLDEIQTKEHFKGFFLDTLYILWDSIDQREGERELNLSLCGGICMVVVTPGR